MNKKLEITTASVTIQLVTVDGKKMTKAVFNQVQEENCLDKNLFFVGDTLLGFVKDGYKWLLWVKNGELRRTNLDFLESFLQYEDIGNLQYFQVRKILKFLGIEIFDKQTNSVHLLSLGQCYKPYVIDDLYKFQETLNNFFESLNGKQLYIAI